MTPLHLLIMFFKTLIHEPATGMALNLKMSQNENFLKLSLRLSESTLA